MGLKFAAGRKIIQLGAAGLLLIPAWFPAHAVWLGSYLSSRFFSIPLTDPMAAAEVMLAAREFMMPLFWSVLPLLVHVSHRRLAFVYHDIAYWHSFPGADVRGRTGNCLCRRNHSAGVCFF